jgi:hypothetical protein
MRPPYSQTLKTPLIADCTSQFTLPRHLKEVKIHGSSIFNRRKIIGKRFLVLEGLVLGLENGVPGRGFSEDKDHCVQNAAATTATVLESWPAFSFLLVMVGEPKKILLEKVQKRPKKRCTLIGRLQH